MKEALWIIDTQATNNFCIEDQNRNLKKVKEKEWFLQRRRGKGDQKGSGVM